MNTRIIRETNIDLLSKNEITSFDFVIDIFQGKPILALSHEYSEWKRYKTLFDARQTSTEKVHLEDFFTNSILSPPDLRKNCLNFCKMNNDIVDIFTTIILYTL
jgi:hypothetical protein